MLFYMVDLKPASEAILKTLSENEGVELPVKDLQSRHNVNVSTICTYLIRLERLGLIARHRANVTRPYSYMLTEEGKALIKRSSQ